jgi:hypothetical protein
LYFAPAVAVRRRGERRNRLGQLTNRHPDLVRRTGEWPSNETPAIRARDAIARELPRPRFLAHRCTYRVVIARPGKAPLGALWAAPRVLCTNFGRGSPHRKEVIRVSCPEKPVETRRSGLLTSCFAKQKQRFKASILPRFSACDHGPRVPQYAPERHR